MAEWPRVSEVRKRRGLQAEEKSGLQARLPRRSAEVQILSETVYGDGRHRVRRFPHSAEQMADRDLHAVQQQERHQRASDSSHAEALLQIRMVSDASNSLRDGGTGATREA